MGERKREEREIKGRVSKGRIAYTEAEIWQWVECSLFTDRTSWQ